MALLLTGRCLPCTSIDDQGENPNIAVKDKKKRRALLCRSVGILHPPLAYRRGPAGACAYPFI